MGGSTAGTQTTYVAYGNGGQNRPLIEGINTTEGTSAAGFYFDYGSFDEVIIGAAGNSAEMPSGGVLTNFIGKSGGNQLQRRGLLRIREPGRPEHRTSPTTSSRAASRTSRAT